MIQEPYEVDFNEVDPNLDVLYVEIPKPGAVVNLIDADENQCNGKVTGWIEIGDYAFAMIKPDYNTWVSGQ